MVSAQAKLSPRLQRVTFSCFAKSIANLGTLTATWLYAHQTASVWTLVKLGKFGSCFLLLIVSYAVVAAVNRPLQCVRRDKRS